IQLAYQAPKEREAMVLGMVAQMAGVDTVKARKQVMVGSKQECLDRIDEYMKAGATHFIFSMRAPYMLDEVQAFAEEVVPAVRNQAP
ncbi:MAG TPA: hypothetical protein VEJ86_12495, partial [Candidatus Binataceae bacterium]|nr:hypothetical protein [Candidatus Binataceae bacterium]